MSESAGERPKHPLPIPAAVVAVAGWVLPGLGHWLAGERHRAAILGPTLLGMFIFGLWIGGIDVVDRRQDTLWFAGQALAGPVAFAADAWHDRLDTARDTQLEAFTKRHGGSPQSHETMHRMIRSGVVPAYRTSVGRVNELGTLFCTLAGVLNLLVVLDAVGRVGGGTERAR